MRKHLMFLLCVLLLASSFGAVEAQTDCAPSQLIPYQSGRVTPGSPNRLRAVPSPSGALMDEIPGDGLFIVLETGVCTEGYLWASVHYHGTVGWTPEAQGNEYYVNPVTPLDGAVILPVTPSWIEDVAWSADGSRIAIATGTGVYLIHTESPNPAPILFTEGMVDELEFSPTQPEVLATSDGCHGMVRVWDIITEDLLYETTVLNPDELNLGCLTSRGTLKYSSDGGTLFAVQESAMRLDTTTWEWMGGFGDYSMEMLLMAPNGEQLAFVTFENNAPYLSDWSNNQTALDRGGLDGWVLSMEFSPDSSMLALLDNHKQVQRWILSTGEQATYRLPYEGDYPIWFSAQLLAFSPDSTLLAVGEISDQPNALRLLDAATMQDAGLFQPENVAEVKAVAFNADGTRIAVIFGNLLMMVDTEEVLAGAG